MFRITINKEQTDTIKGVGILLIVLHNYFHWVPPNTGENEFIFDIQNSKNVLSAISDSYLNTINVLFSFLGHYGVQLFIFISGYGLAKSFLNKPQNFSVFIKKRAFRIYPAFLVSILVLIIYNAILFSKLPNIGWANILTKLLMIHTILPGKALTINGPWWFYGLIMQLYILFIPLFYAIKKWQLKGFLFVISLSYCLIYFLYTPLLNKDIYIMANAPAHIPEFALGILLAINPNLTIRTRHIPLLVLAFLLGNYSFPFFPFTFIIITYLLTLSILYIFRGNLVSPPVIRFYGKISMYLFAIHGFFRMPFFVPWAEASNNPFITVAIGMLYLLTVTVVAYVSQEVYTLIIQWLKTYKRNRQNSNVKV